MEFDQYKKSDEKSSITYADRETLIEKIEKSSTRRVNHFPSGFSMVTILSFKYIQNKHNIIITSKRFMNV